MDDQAAFQATYADFKLVKTRRVIQVVFEVPLEQSEFALAALGGLPTPDAERWFAIARLETREVRLPEAKPKRLFNELPPTQQAAIRCGEKPFQHYLEEVHLIGECGPEEATTFVRDYCGVKSRAEINTNPAATEQWLRLEEDYQLWMTTPV